MSPAFGRHYRRYRLAAALDRLRDMPDGLMLPLRKAAQLLGTSEATVRRLVTSHAHPTAIERNMVSAVTLRQVVRMAHQARWPR